MINHIFFGKLIIARTVETKNHLYRWCLIKWSRLNEPTKQHIMPQSKDMREQLRSQWHQPGNCYKATIGHYPHLDSIWNCGEPSHEQLPYQSYSKSASTTHQGGHKRTQNNILRLAQQQWPKTASMREFQWENHCNKCSTFWNVWVTSLHRE